MGAEPRALSLRKDEIDAVVEVLEQDHETVRDAAKAALKVAYRLMQARDWYVITTRDFGLTYGIYATEAEVIAKAEQGHDLGLGGNLYVTKVNSTLAQEARVKELDAASHKQDRVCKCQHRESEHEGTGRCLAPVKKIGKGNGAAKPCSCRRLQVTEGRAK